ncbi:hypothetical protein ASPVEDRAFT_441075 [Aspergillus versicolor CBS 583.65]|uniref:Uncharacterized protein n=1 Tax=Aspergillus versicolor CBS 583.65 TaxID=1036611 RepID=A0A1L9P964_ASPVE|nr:uncharacterized protein ASPVEDRAFT_441075 [Aspergillus versicolor CBS 583.65]OJI98022.1 hypothetical protein ASPVEDRAFT_441075 [Aspergillus versicolor CBS 583.65]
MDPMSAIGVAANILQFVEFGAKLCGRIQEVASSATGLTEENAHLDSTVDELRNVTDGLITNLKGNTQHEAELVKLAAQCRDLSAELTDMLSKLKPKKDDRFWSSIRAAWKSTVKEKKVLSIERRLGEYRAQIILRLNFMLYNEQSPIKEYLKRLELQAINLKDQHDTQAQTQQDLLRGLIQRLETMKTSNDVSSGLTACHDVMQEPKSGANKIPDRNEILRALYFKGMFHRDDNIHVAVGDTYRWLIRENELCKCSEKSKQDSSIRTATRENNFDNSVTDSAPNGVEKPADIVSPELVQLKEHSTDKQEALKTVAHSTSGEQDEDDEGDIENRKSDACFHCLQEAFEEEVSLRKTSASRFMQFLLYENSVFFIYGKAGSGKSTLMKYLAGSENATVRGSLNKWAGGCRLVSVAVFFWNAGGSLQKSLEGLYRSLLYQVLRQCPGMATGVFGDRSGLSEWEEARLPLLKKSMAKLVQILHHGQYRLCLFVDGLDEYEGDSRDKAELVKEVQTWGAEENVKIICSARPHPEYMHAFTNHERCVPLHEHTKADILEYAMNSFCDASSSDCSTHSSLLTLAKEIVARAEGVFLWAYLVVRSLSSKLQIYSIKQLQGMLRATPRTLDSLFDQLLEDLDPLSQQQAEKFLLLAAHSPYYTLSALSFSWIKALENPNFPFDKAMCCYSNIEIKQRLDRIQKQVEASTRGMLEIQPSRARFGIETHVFFRSRIDFFHRSFREYLLARWHDKKPPGFETYVRIALAEVKFSYTMDSYTVPFPDFEPCFDNLTILRETLDWLSKDRTVLPSRYCEEIERIFDSYKGLLHSSLQTQDNNRSKISIFQPHTVSGASYGTIEGQSKITYRETNNRECSFSSLNFLAVYIPSALPYLIQRIKEFPTTQRRCDNLVDALISASLSGNEEILEAVLPYFMEKGVTPNSVTTAWQQQGSEIKASTITAWLALIAESSVSRVYAWRTIETYLRLGADPCVIFLIFLGWIGEEEQGDEMRMRYAELPQLIERYQAENKQSLLQLLRPAASGRSWWNDVTSIYSTWASQPKQPNYIEEARERYKQATDAELSDKFLVMEVMTSDYRLTRDFIIQLY